MTHTTYSPARETILAYETYGDEYVKAYNQLAENDPYLAEATHSALVEPMQEILKAYGLKHDYGFAEEVQIYAKARYDLANNAC